MEKVSIIMGIYNCEKTIGECIESILSQTYKNWELIMCDDGSKDQTYKIAMNYRDKYPNKIKLLKNEVNIKLAATLNRCLKIADGKYIARMDADDISLPTRLEKQVNFLENHKEYHLVGSQRILFDEMGDRGIKGQGGEPTRLSLKTNVPFAHPTIMMKKEVYDELKGYSVSNEITRCEDLDLWFRFYEKGFRGYNLPEPLLKYREGIDDYNKRKFKYGVETSKVFLKGYKMLGYPKHYYLFALKPIISTLVPKIIMRRWHDALINNK